MRKLIKRSKGVIIFAAILFFVHLFFETKMPSEYPKYFLNYDNLFYLLDIITNIAAIIIALCLLFLKELIRKIVVFFHTIVIADAVTRLSISYPNIIKNYSEADIAKHQFIVFFASITTIGICSIYIYFFTRPKVKEQFK
jgi:hypothetical protein